MDPEGLTDAATLTRAGMIGGGAASMVVPFPGARVLGAGLILGGLTTIPGDTAIDGPPNCEARSNRGQQDPSWVPQYTRYNPGRYPNGKCKPCENSPIFKHDNQESHPCNGHQIRYHQNPETCECFPYKYDF